MRKKRILFIFLIPSSFVIKDLQILRAHFDVKTVDFVLKRTNPLSTLNTIFGMIRGILWADVTFSWFINIHALWAVRLSKIFRKKSIVVIGGFEVAKVPEIGYGAMLNPSLTRIVRYVIENADIVLTVDDGLKRDALKNVGVKGNNIQTVPTGYDYNIFKPGGKKENLIITVASADDWMRVRLKGLSTFVESTKFLPNMKFLIIGINGDVMRELQNIATQNVGFIEYISQDALIPYYQKAKVYCQLSMREGLPNALCEAMLCECVPVGTDVQGIRTAIGNTGFYVPYGDAKATVEAIKNAVESNRGKYARERIKNMFPIERREMELQEIIRGLLQ